MMGSDTDSILFWMDNDKQIECIVEDGGGYVFCVFNKETKNVYGKCSIEVETVKCIIDMYQTKFPSSFNIDENLIKGIEERLLIKKI